jgi:hypothetical protein
VSSPGRLVISPFIVPPRGERDDGVDGPIWSVPVDVVVVSAFETACRVGGR